MRASPFAVRSSARLVRAGGRGGGTAGNERLTASTAAVLVLLLAVEGVTILFLRPLLSVHVFVGMLLIPPVALKLASTGYRFARYYTGSPVYRSKGPPHLLLRLLAPLVVLSTLVLFASGVYLLATGPPGGFVVGLHKVSFVVWLAATGVHVLAYLRRVPPLVAAEWRPRATLAGAGSRRLLVLAVLVAGVVLAAVTLPLASAWHGWLE
ncbi:MAG: hypothetical protein ACRDM1_05710 [Gaiellaceae bacterium]